MDIPEPKVEFIEGTIRVRLLEDWLFCINGDPRIIIPKGFETDFASVPRFLWPVASPMGILRYGSIPHDFGYQYGYLLSAEDLSHVHSGASRDFFDTLLMDLTVAKTGAKYRAYGAYAMVRAFGWRPWNKYRKLGPEAYNSNSLNL